MIQVVSNRSAASLVGPQSWSRVAAYAAAAFTSVFLLGLLNDRSLVASLLSGVLASIGSAAGGAYMRFGELRDRRRPIRG
jgi:hypothetical protein